MLGGTLTELAWLQGKIEGLRAWLDELGIDRVEVSSGVVPMPPSEKAQLIATLARDRTVYAEVGEKDPRALMAPYRWVAADPRGAGGRRGAGGVRGPRGRVGRRVPARRRGPHRPDRRDRPRDRPRPADLRGAAAPPADLVHRALSARTSTSATSTRPTWSRSRPSASGCAPTRSSCCTPTAGDPPRATRRDRLQRAAAALHGLDGRAAERPRPRAGARARRAREGPRARGDLVEPAVRARGRRRRSSAPRSA